MAANIAPTTFERKPDDKAVAVDVYNNPPAKPVNLLTTNQNALEAFGLKKDSVSAAVAEKLLDNYIKTGKLVDVDQAVKQISKAYKTTVGNIRSTLSDGKFYDSMLQAGGFYNTPLGSKVNALVASGLPLDKQGVAGTRDINLVIGNAKKLIKNVKDIDSISDAAGFLGGLNPDLPIIKAVNLTQVALVAKGASLFATDVGITKSLDRLFSTLDSSEDRKRVSQLIVSSNTTPITPENMEVILEDLPGDEVIANSPDVMSYVMAGFRDSAEYPTPSQEALTYLLGVIEAIKPDPWYISVNGANTLDLSIFRDASQFTLECLKFDERFKKVGFLIERYQASPFKELAKTYYPYIGI